MVLGIDSVVVLAEHVGVLHIGRRTLQTVQAQQAQTENIFADGGFIFIRGIVRRLTLQLAQIVADQLQVGDRAVDRGAGIDRRIALSAPHAGQLHGGRSRRCAGNRS